MSRDLFADTFAARPAPRRSKWMIVVSFLAHAGAIGVLVIVPILSALDSFVLHANDVLVVSIPATTMPSPPPPPKAETPAPSDINPFAAPPSPPEKPVTGEAPQLAFGAGPGVPGAPAGTGLGDLGPVPPSSSAKLPPQAPPKPAGPFRPGGDIKPPERVTYVEPVYPTLAKTAKVEGTVILEATIDEAGLVKDVRVLRSIPLLDRAAIEAVSKWRYTSTRLNGVAVPVLLTVTVTFKLR